MKESILSCFIAVILVSGCVKAKESYLKDDIKLKGRISLLSGWGVSTIVRGEGWVKYKPYSLDFKGRLELKNGTEFQKYRLQYMPLHYQNLRYGMAVRYRKKEGKPSAWGIGVALKLTGDSWKIPFRYYPDLKLIHTKPQIKWGQWHADCQILDYHARNVWSVRPGIDWRFHPALSIGMEGRVYSKSKKNYLGLRLRWSIK